MFRGISSTFQKFQFHACDDVSMYLPFPFFPQRKWVTALNQTARSQIKVYTKIWKNNNQNKKAFVYYLELLTIISLVAFTLNVTFSDIARWFVALWQKFKIRGTRYSRAGCKNNLHNCSLYKWVHPPKLCKSFSWSCCDRYVSLRSSLPLRCSSVFVLLACCAGRR